LGGENEGCGGILEVSRIFGGFLWDNAGLRIFGVEGYSSKGGWDQNLINSVEGGVAGVKLDGGEDSLSGSARGGDSVVGESSSGKGGSGETGSSIGVGGGKGITGVGSRGSNDLGGTTLPLGTGNSMSGYSGIESSLEFGLGGSNLGGIFNRGGTDGGEDGSNKGSGGGGSRGSGKVGTRHLETVDGVSVVVDSLEDTVSVHILIRALGHSISVARLSSGRWATSVTESELSKLVLSMELMRLLMDWSGVNSMDWSGNSIVRSSNSMDWCIGPGGNSEQLSAGSAHASCQYNQSVHV